MKKYCWWIAVAYAIGVLLVTVFLRESKEVASFNIELSKGYFGGLETDMTRQDTLMNVLAFIPFGLLICFACKRYGVGVALLAGLFLSETVECLQAVLKRGIFDVNDLLANTLGVGIGCVVYLMIMLIVKLRGMAIARKQQ